ncbi:hypothetical protein ACTHSJ_25855 [Paenibacillus cellulositrophicus]|uniref:hypothetical protein n=1 Tax=Paenibacillus cellulositrophicus TaxID=562959 RepID=UPI003F8039AB
MTQTPLHQMVSVPDRKGIYIELIHSIGISFAIPVIRGLHASSNLSLSEIQKSSITILRELKEIAVSHFQHCEGYDLTVKAGLNEHMGYFIELQCPCCRGFDSNFTRCAGTNNGKPIHQITYNWEKGLIRKAMGPQKSVKRL